MRDARLLVATLRDPASVGALSPERWTALIAIARAEKLIGSLAWRLESEVLAEPIAAILAEAGVEAKHARRQALWEAEMARRALAPLGIPVILLKGTAYAAAGLAAGKGRSIGDLDILVPREALPEVERALLGAGWEWVKEDAYDDHYYREWMHELPPLIHRERDRMIDVHHTILPLTARPRPDAAALIAGSVAVNTADLPNPFGLSLSKPFPSANEEKGRTREGFDKLSPNGEGGDLERTSDSSSAIRILSPPDMIVHAAAHLFADGDLAGGLRNLWDIDRLLRDFSDHPDFWAQLAARAALHGLGASVGRAVRLAHALYGTPAPDPWIVSNAIDRLFMARLLARNGWGQATRPMLRLAFYVRSHTLRMPPLMLARHLWIKMRR
jgi:hypothetical protein